MDPVPLAVLALFAFAAAGAAAARWPEGVVAHAGAVLLALAAVTLGADAALVRLDPPGLRLAIDPSTEPLLPARDPAREVYRAAVRNFGADEVFVVAMQTDDVFRADRLHSLRAATDAIARLPEVRRVQSLTDVVAFDYDPALDSLDVHSLIEEIPTEPGALAALRERAVRDPLYRRTLVSDDGATAAINVTFREMTDAEFIAAGVDGRIEALLAGLATPGLHFYVAGRPHVKDAVYHGMLRDLRVLIPAALCVIGLGLAVLFGNRRGVVLPLGLIAVATVWTFGAMALLGRSLSVLTTLLAPMLAAIGSVYGIHAVNRYEEEAAEARDARAAAAATLRHLRVPVLLAGVTTMVGFAALMLTDVPAVFELGAFSVLGVAALTLLTLTGLPALLALLPLRAEGTRTSARIAAALDRALASLVASAATHPDRVLLGFAAALLVLVAAIPAIRIDTDYLSFFDERAPVRREFEAVNRLLAGAVPLYVAFEGGGPGAFREPEALAALARVQDAAERAPHVGRTLSLTDTLRVMNRAMSRDDPRAERVPETRGGVAELLFLAPKGDLDRYTNVSHARANLLVRTGAVGTAAVEETAAALEAGVAGVALPPGVTAAVTGNALLLARSADGIARGQPRTVGVAALAIFALVLVGFRSLRLASVAMLPNLAPVAAYFGMLGLGAAPLSLPTSLIGSVALGIAIDDTVHFLVRYRAERAGGLSPEQAAAVAGRRIGRAIVITSAMLIAGFLVVALSGFATLRQFGLLSAATMAAALASDLLLLPALLVRTKA